MQYTIYVLCIIHGDDHRPNIAEENFKENSFLARNYISFVSQT